MWIRRSTAPSLMPADPKQRAEVMQWVSLVITAINPVVIGGYLAHYVFPRTPDGTIDRSALDAVWPDVKGHLEILEKAVADGYLANGAFSLADAYLVPVLYFSAGHERQKPARQLTRHAH